jgi:D-alanine-D-alanine ligase
MASKVKVGIVAGGKSSEHEISCISANGVLSAIDRELFEPVLIGITKSGKWVLPPSGYKLTIDGDKLPVISEELPETTIDKLDVDLLFPVLHGPYGEDGTFQGQCEMAGIKYVGSGVLASATGMDKSFAKPIFQSHGLKVAPGMVMQKSDWLIDELRILAEATKFGNPLFVKPARSGSSRGTSKVKKADELKKAINFALEYDTKVMVESAIVGREIECAVLQVNGVALASPLGEIKILGNHEFYDFEAKYLDNSTELITPVKLPFGVQEAIQDAATTAFNALGCEGLARVDFFYTGKEIIINEINTMPGFTATSVFPKLWQAGGIEYTELITKLIQAAQDRPLDVTR